MFIFLSGCTSLNRQIESSLDSSLESSLDSLIENPIENLIESSIEFRAEAGIPHEEEEIAVSLPVPGRHVYLTFDDGPSPNTNRILDLLARYGIRATFFLVGDHILDNEFMSYEDAERIVQRIHREGHYIGLHSMSHVIARLYQSQNAAENFYNEMRELHELIYEITGEQRSFLYRAPYGTRGMFTREHIRVMSGSGFLAWDWNIDTEDWRARSVDAIMEKIAEDLDAYDSLPQNAVILLHERNITLEALPFIIEYFLEMDYVFMHYVPENHFMLNLLHNPGI